MAPIASPTADQIYDLEQGIRIKPNQVVARMYQVANRVCNHFAIRPRPAYHPAGEGTMMESFILDHIPSGLKLLGNDYGVTSYDECEAFAKMIASAPVDWSEKRPRMSNAVQNYFRHVHDVYRECKVVTWDEFHSKVSSDAETE